MIKGPGFLSCRTLIREVYCANPTYGLKIQNVKRLFKGPHKFVFLWYILVGRIRGTYSHSSSERLALLLDKMNNIRMFIIYNEDSKPVCIKQLTCLLK